jgi:hypothetical protein
VTIDVDAPEYQLDPPPPRYSKWKVGLFCWFTFLLLICFFYPYEDGQINWLGVGINSLFMLVYGLEIYRRRKQVMLLERLHRHFEALKRIVKTPTMRYDEETKTYFLTWLFSLTPEDVDKMMMRKQ